MEQMARLLLHDGFQVDQIRNGREEDWREKVSRADALLLPYPFSQKDGRIPGWENGGECVESLLQYVKHSVLIMAGRGVGSPFAEESVWKLSVLLKFYEDDPLFTQRNAEISAEAAVCEVMTRSRRMLDEQNILVVGYGRFARAITWRLKELGARVWVAARREKSRCCAIQDGLQAIALEQMAHIAPEIQIVINTVPAVVIGPAELSCFPDDALLLELASSPYGIHLSAAVDLEKNVVVLPGLPARYAPASAAKALRDAVIRQIREADR